ncbi:hypothetical protein [Rhizobium leguminosarum]
MHLPPGRGEALCFRDFHEHSHRLPSVHARRNHPVHRFSGILVKQIARKKLQAANRKRYCKELMQVIRKLIAERPLRRFPGGNGRGMGEGRPRTAVG